MCNSFRVGLVLMQKKTEKAGLFSTGSLDLTRLSRRVDACVNRGEVEKGEPFPYGGFSAIKGRVYLKYCLPR